MKRLKAIVTKKDGTTKEVFVDVDDQTAEMLAQVDDKKMVNDYLAEEYRMFMADYKYHRNVQSLDNYMKQGIEIEDPRQDLLENAIQEIENDKLREAIKQLLPQQQWLIEQIFFERRSQVEIAKELGIDETSLSKRKERIIKKLKKLLQ